MRSSKNKKQNKIDKFKILTVIISVLLLFTGNRWASKNAGLLTSPQITCKAKVTELTTYFEQNDTENNNISKFQFFRAQILTGENKGEIIETYQQTDSYNDTGERFVKPGDRIILYNYGNGDFNDYVFGSYARFGNILVLGIIYFALVIFMGRAKGLNTILSLLFTCIAVFFVFLPAVIAGKNVYLMTVLVCIYTIIMTLILVNGTSKKSLCTMLGCMAGVLAAAVLTIIFDKWMHLTGVIDEHSIYIKILNENGGGINLRALIFAMITIGAMGAVMDVAMDISSSLYEIKYHAPNIKRRELFRSGLNIGRDVMGTMANTLVLAYIGSSLCTIILKVSYAGSLMELVNTESITVELLQALIGSLGIFLTIPLTALIACVLYTGKESESSNV